MLSYDVVPLSSMFLDLVMVFVETSSMWFSSLTVLRDLHLQC